MPTLGGGHPHTRLEAELESLTQALRGYGVLTDERLKELSHARHWREPVFDAVLCEAMRRGLIRRLGDCLYELAEPGWP